MIILLAGFGLFAGALLIQLMWWHIHLPKRHTRTLALVMGCLAILWLFVGAMLSVSGPEQISIFILYFSLCAGYLITYSAVEVDSPSLVIIKKVDEAGEGGLTKAELERWAKADRLVRPRLQDLVRDGHVRMDSHGKISLTSRGIRFVSIFVWYRALLKRPMGG